MTVRRALALLMLLVGPFSFAGPNEALAAAARDILTVPADAQSYQRYFTRHAISEKRRADFGAASLFHWNSLSHEADFAAFAPVSDEVYRVDLRDIGLSPETWELLRDDEPYFHARVRFLKRERKETIAVGDKVRVVSTAKADDGEVLALVGDVLKVVSVTEFNGFVSVINKEGKRVALLLRRVVPFVEEKDEEVAFGPWLDAAAILALSKATHSQVPIVRADWFLVYTAANVDRKAGYYKFLGIKTEKDIEELAGIDRARARRLRRELAAIILNSGVAINDRQVVRVEPGYWETIDSRSSKGRQNVRVQLNGDLDGDAKEVYFRLPCDLFGTAAVQIKDVGDVKAGTLQETVPDFIAHDHSSTSNDLRIHPLKSCASCHEEGLRPLDDYARKFYTVDPLAGGVLLTSPDYEKFKRLKRLYLGPLQDGYDDDIAVYKRALVRLLGPGWTPQRISRAYASAWEQYLDVPVRGQQLALELGCSRADMLRAFEAVVKSAGANADPIMLGYIRKREIPARREHIEEDWPQLALAVKGLRLP